MTDQEMWNNDDPISDLNVDIEVPGWIDQDISPQNIAAIVQGGCASGAYMPAVTYHQALETMSEYGDDILDYIENVMGDLPDPTDKSLSWSADSGHRCWQDQACPHECHRHTWNIERALRASYYVSLAVEIWSLAAHDELEYS